VDDGGTARVVAIASFVEDVLGGEVLDVAELARGRRLGYVGGLVEALRRLSRSGCDTLVLAYPGFPGLGLYRTGGSLDRVLTLVAHAGALAIVGVLAAVSRRQGRPLVADIHDVPSLEHHLPDRRRVAPARLTAIYERVLLRAALVVWVVTEQEREALVGRYGGNAEAFVVVPNGSARLVQRPPRDRAAPVRIAYTGSLYRDRAVLEATIRELLESDTAKLELVLAGPGGEWLADTFPDERVRYVGWLGARECEELLASCDLGLLPYFGDEPYYRLVHPTKLSVYLACGLPIVSGDAAHVAAFVSRHGVGVAADRRSYTAAALDLAADAARRSAFAESARALAPAFLWDTLLAEAFEATSRVVAARRAEAPGPRA
jgi:glycosyltransferase involved in cell wall biosynthesis